MDLHPRKFEPCSQHLFFLLFFFGAFFGGGGGPGAEGPEKGGVGGIMEIM